MIKEVIVAKSIEITKFRQMYDFIVFLLTKSCHEISKNRITKELRNYVITGICNCISDENDKCYGTCCGSFYLSSMSNEDGIFPADDYFLFSSNIGIFIFHTDEKGHLKECEFFYETEFFPEFYLDILKSFKTETEFDSFMRFLKVNNVKLRTLSELKEIFRYDKLNIIEVE
ncbi:hypothetical protein FHQ18_09560 [Deferribacter autotrophicus]|uniref:Uncharacterized protein n=1 Tax=Deferribacter autotrophicus TaxID=500465 RepID=A0A5A8EZY7_9BACT|nr:hypothetical protein [Deferribacter autotrophicus]KAA0257286.1 hypothetical protein FHQ18_09560 [Deferribacter autotrophicus]